MVRVISQETFDSTVQENIEVFALSPEDALKETIEQFGAQGIDLTNIVKSVQMIDGNDLIAIAIENLRNSGPENCLDNLEILQEHLQSDIALKIRAGKMGAYEVLLQKVETYSERKEVCCAFLKVLTLLMDGYPDLLEEKGVNFIINGLKNYNHDDVAKFILQWAYKCCLRHEKNRQDLINGGIVPAIKGYIDVDIPPGILQSACHLISALTLDDDIRHAVSNAHKHACLLATEFLIPLNKCLGAYMNDADTLCIILNTMSKLLVRNEYCEMMIKEGCLKVISDCISQFLDKEKVHRKALMVLTSLAGNDDAKTEIILTGMSPLIVSSMTLNSNYLEYCIAASNLIAMLCLRNSKNSKTLFDLGCADIIIGNMKTHKRSSKLQMVSCRAFRNMISHNPEISTELLKRNIEDIIHEVLKTHEDCKDHAKELLKQLGCKVHLTELWTGQQGNKLNQ